jgi:hypothetical protein
MYDALRSARSGRKKEDSKFATHELSVEIRAR